MIETSKYLEIKALIKLYPHFFTKNIRNWNFRIGDSDEGLTFLYIFWFDDGEGIRIISILNGRIDTVFLFFVLICGGIFYEVDEDLIFYVFCFRWLG